ncbi:hypothetical protein REPUB_Repub07fG0099100 [Reevesia pubescens]
MEYFRKVTMANGVTAATAPTDSRGDGDDASAVVPSTAGSQQPRLNVVELLVGRGFGTVIRHKDFEERSNYYDALLAAESRADEVSNGAAENKQKELLKVVVTEELGGGKFYVQTQGDQRVHHDPRFFVLEIGTEKMPPHDVVNAGQQV